MTCVVRTDTSLQECPHTTIFDPDAAVVQTDHLMRKLRVFKGRRGGKKKTLFAWRVLKGCIIFPFRQTLRNGCKPVEL